PCGRELVADAERVGEVVEAVDHQPMAEAVDALVEEEVRLRDRLAGAKAARDRGDLRARDAAEGALDDAVVVAGPARHRAVRKRDCPLSWYLTYAAWPISCAIWWQP